MKIVKNRPGIVGGCLPWSLSPVYAHLLFCRGPGPPPRLAPGSTRGPFTPETHPSPNMKSQITNPKSPSLPWSLPSMLAHLLFCRGPPRLAPPPVGGVIFRTTFTALRHRRFACGELDIQIRYRRFASGEFDILFSLAFPILLCYFTSLKA